MCNVQTTRWLQRENSTNRTAGSSEENELGAGTRSVKASRHEVSNTFARKQNNIHDSALFAGRQAGTLSIIDDARLAMHIDSLT